MVIRAHHTLVFSIVACILHATGAQLGGYTNSTYAKSVSLKLAKSSLVVLQNNPVTCVLPVGSDGTVGSFLARMKANASSQTAIQSLSVGAFIPISGADLEGPVPWLFTSWFPAQANVTFKFVAVKIDSNHVDMSDRTAVAVTALALTGADCVLDGITVDTNVSSLFRLSSPISAYGYQTIVPRATVFEESTMKKVWLWTQPYSWPVWIVVIGIFLATAFIVAIMDIDHRHTKDTDFIDNVPIVRNVAHFLYLSAVTLTGHGSFRPYSASGRLYIMAKAFCLLILWSCYRAALTAYFVTPPTPQQPVSTIADFLSAFGTGTPACIPPDTHALRFMGNAYPDIKVSRSAPGTSTWDLLEDIASGGCAAGVAASDELAFYMGHEDNKGDFCGMEAKDFLGHFTRAIPFNPATVGPVVGGYDSPAWFDGFFRVECKATQDLNFSNFKEAWMPSHRPLCTEQEEEERHILKEEVEGVGVIEVIGIFSIQAMGFFFGLVLHIRDKTFPSELDHDKTMAIVPEDALDEELHQLEGMAAMLRQRKEHIASLAIEAGNEDRLKRMVARHSEAEMSHKMMAARSSLQRIGSNVGRSLL